MSLKDIDGTAITTKYIIRFFNIFVAFKKAYSCFKEINQSRCR